MKIKLDFITNSSSSAFFFFFKDGDLETLFDVIMKHSETFKVQYGEYYMDSSSLIDAIKSIHDLQSKLFETSRVRDDLIFEIYSNIESVFSLNNSEDSDPDWIGYRMDSLREIMTSLQKVEKFQIKGFSKCFTIEFGDNDGDISGGNIGICMDYQHYDLQVEFDDLSIITESRH